MTNTEKVITEKDIGKICLFWNDKQIEYVIGLLISYTSELNGRFYTCGWYEDAKADFDNCKVLTPEMLKEIQANPKKYMFE